MLERLKLGRGQTLHIAVEAQRLSLVLVQGRARAGAARVLAQQVLADGSAGARADAVPQLLDGLLAAANLRGLPTKLVLADTWVRSWRVEPPPNATRLQDCEAAVRMRFQQVFDEAPEGWQFSPASEVKAPFLACAVRQAWATALVQVLQAHQLALVAMEPEFVVLWNHWQPHLPTGAWLGICQADGVTLGVVQQGRLVALRRLPRPALPLAEASGEPAALLHAVQHEADRWNLPMPSGLSLCGAVPSAWLGRWSAGVDCALLGPQGSALALWGVQA
jgi:hypothetical protein